MTMLYESRIDPGQVALENGIPTLTVENASFVFALDPDRRLLQAQYMTSKAEANWELPLASF